MAATWTYTHGPLAVGTPTVSQSGKCHGICIMNSSDSADASFKVNAGDTIALRPSRILNVNPRGKLFNPSITWVSGTMDVTIEIVQ